ncbi:MAG: TonB-dependent receptor [Ferruginibacter sp.]
MKQFLFLLAAVISGNQLQAQHDTTAKTLDETVVTASKVPVKQSQTGKVVTVIGKEQLDRSAGKTVAQVLTEQAGVTINGAYNAPGSVQTTFVRGGSSGRTLILIDGIPVSDPSMINNEFDLNMFSIHDVERIEICKGAQSTLYGSDAIAGVINIITVKKDVTKVINVKATASYGSKNTFRGNLQLFGKAGKLSYTARYANLTTGGFSSAYDSTGSTDYDRDGYRGNVMNAAVQYLVISSLQLKTFVQYSRYKADIDAGVFADENDYTISNSYLNAGGGAFFKKGIVSVTANYQFGEMKRRYLNDSTDKPGFTSYENNRYSARTQYLELYSNIEAAKWLTVLAGADYRRASMRQKYYSESFFGPYDPPAFDSALHQTSFYSSFFFHFPDKKLNIEIGGRTNKHSRYGSNSTFTFNPSFRITKNWRVFGSIASGFKAPSIYQVFDAFSGNPDLEPEKSVNYELGVQQSHQTISSRVVYFHRDIRNGIDYDYVNFKYFNFVKQQVDGVELELLVRPVKKLTITANYTYIGGDEKTQSRKSTNDTTYNYLLRRPKSSFNLNTGYQFTKGLYAAISARAVGDRYDVGGYQKEDVLLENYFLLGLYAEYNWKDRFRFFLDAQNLTNTRFFDLRGYNSIPFLVNAGVTFSW